MSQLCVIYLSEDEDIAGQLVTLLKKHWEVWWAQDIAHGDWEEAVRNAIYQSTAVVAVLSQHAKGKRKTIIKDEMRYAEKEGKKIFPLLIGPADVPFGFGDLNHTEAHGWNGDENAPSYLQLKNKIAATIGGRRELRPAISDDGLDRLQWGITGLRPDWRGQVVSEEPVIACEPKPAMSGNGSDTVPPKLEQKTTRYLRRRCRVITRGSKQFQTILHHLLSRQFDREEAIKKFNDSWEKLKDPYEKMMVNAAYLEVIGDIELMQKTLGEHKFSGSTENARKLYEAIACEKLDDLEHAQKLLQIILNTEEQNELRTAAQFNRHVCYEKASDFDNVKFAIFFQYKEIIFVDGERLSDKAVAMHMISCMEQKQPFVHNNLMTNSLDFLRENSSVGYSKSLLTKIEYEKSLLTEKDVNEILNNLKLMDTNSSTAIMIQLYNYLPSEAKAQRKVIIESIHLNPNKSDTVIKWMLAHGHAPRS